MSLGKSTLDLPSDTTRPRRRGVTATDGRAVCPDAAGCRSTGAARLLPQGAPQLRGAGAVLRRGAAGGAVGVRAVAAEALLPQVHGPGAGADALRSRRVYVGVLVGVSGALSGVDGCCVGAHVGRGCFIAGG